MAYRILNYESNKPILLASGPLSNSAKAINYWHKKGIELVVTKTIYGKKTYNGKIYNTEHYTFNRDGFSNLSINEWCNELANTQKNKVIVSVSGDTPQKVVRYCEILQNIGIDKFELCFSCSNLGGEPICYDIRKLERFCKYVRRYVLSNISVKVVLSLSQKTNIDMVKTIAYCGMNAVTISDTIPALVLDKNKKAMFGGVGGLSGSFLKPLVLKALNDIQNIRIEKIAVGGVESKKDIDDYISVGANIVGICSGIIRNGGIILDAG